MVTFINVSCCSHAPLPTNWSAREDRLVTGGPLYAAVDVLALLEKGIVATRLWTADCSADVALEGWGLSDVVRLVEEAVRHGTYKNSQWCRQGVEGDVVPCAPCDAYAVRFRHVDKGWTSYYVKFAVSKNGALLLVFSCHP